MTDERKTAMWRRYCCDKLCWWRETMSVVRVRIIAEQGRCDDCPKREESK